jgi:predicted phage terminase large subunit-like protein
MANNLEKKLASVLVNSEKNAVLKELNILKPDDPIERAKVNANIIDDDRIKTLLKFRKNIPQENLALYKKELERENAKMSYLDFLKYTYPDFIPTKFHQFLANVAEDVVKKVEKGKRVRICLSLAPRHGKSMIFAETLPTWFVGRNPNFKAILTAYNAETAEKFGDRNRQKARKHWKELWGHDISPSQDNKSLFEVKGKHGGIMSVGITGGITGNGGQLIIVDDPYKNGIEAANAGVRDNVESMFRDSVLTRAEGKGNAIIVVHTRWHEEDLIGKLSKENGWVVINIPVVADGGFDVLKRQKGEMLCPELGFDAEWAKATHASVGKRVWSALYMGKPSIENGNLFQRHMFKFYTKSELPTVFDEVVQSWDLALDKSKSSDYVAGQVWGRKGGNHYLLKRMKRRMSFTETIEMMKHFAATFNHARRIYVEKRANGAAVIETLNKEVGGIVPINPKESKVGRAEAIAPYFEAGNIFVPHEQLDPTIEDYIQEFMRFPNSDHDDEVDSTTQYLNEIRYKNSGKILLGSNIERINRAFRGANIKI